MWIDNGLWPRPCSVVNVAYSNWRYLSPALSAFCLRFPCYMYLWVLVNAAIIIGRDYSTVDGRASGNAIGPERHVIAEGYRLGVWLRRWNFCLTTTLTLILTLRPSRRLPWPYHSRPSIRFWKLLCAGILWLCTELFLHRRRCSSHFDNYNRSKFYPQKISF